MSDENKIEQINDFLVSIIVERKDLLNRIIEEMNNTIRDTLKINFQYTYDDFCKDYLSTAKDFFERHPDVDYTDMNMVNFYTNIIINELFVKIKMKYGKNDGTKSNG